MMTTECCRCESAATTLDEDGDPACAEHGLPRTPEATYRLARAAGQSQATACASTLAAHPGLDFDAVCDLCTRVEPRASRAQRRAFDHAE